MELFIPWIVLNFIVALVMYFYFCCVLSSHFKWHLGILYAALYLGISLLDSTSYIPSFIFIFAEIILLSLFAMRPLKQSAIKSFSIASLIISAHSITGGIAESLIFWIVDSLSTDFIIVMKYADVFRYVLTILLLILTLHSISRILAEEVQQINRWALPVLVVPVLFIALTEKIVSAHIYGSTVVWNNEKGLISPVANSPELLVLRVFALISLFSAIAGCKKLIAAIYNERLIFQLEQQAEYQESYIREAKARYQQTASFRHDVQNHLTVLGQLLVIIKLRMQKIIFLIWWTYQGDFLFL